MRCKSSVQDLKYDILKHPNVKDTTDGQGENYVHGFGDYSSYELYYDDFKDIDINDLPKADVVIYSSEEIEQYLLNLQEVAYED